MALRDIESEHFNIKITGAVQGVFFRIETKKKADELKLKGFVKNEDDGSVYIEIEGTKKTLDIFREWINEHPGYSKIENVFIEEGESENFSTFEIKY